MARRRLQSSYGPDEYSPEEETRDLEERHDAMEHQRSRYGIDTGNHPGRQVGRHTFESVSNDEFARRAVGGAVMEQWAARPDRDSVTPAGLDQTIADYWHKRDR